MSELKQLGYTLGIVTSNTEENVRLFLLRNKFESFDFIYSGRSIFGKSKLLKNVLQEKKLTTKDVVYIGDEVRDIEACHKSKIAIICVSWGFNTKEVLEKNKPNYIVDTPSQLKKLISSIS